MQSPGDTCHTNPKLWPVPNTLPISVNGASERQSSLVEISVLPFAAHRPSGAVPASWTWSVWTWSVRVGQTLDH